MSGRLHRFLKEAAETVVAIGVVLAFFVIILGMLETFFPVGTSVRELVRNDASRPGRFEGRRDISIVTPEDGGRPAWTAVLSETARAVKSKDADGIVWRDAAAGMSLRDRDAVQTLKGSAAVISFDAETRLRLGENSLVVIQRVDGDPVLRERRRISMAVDGELSGTLAGRRNGAAHFEFTVPNATVRLPARSATHANTEFKLSVNPNDNSSTIVVFKGAAEVVTPAGKQFRVEANHAATIDATGVTTTKISTPPSPAPLSPAAEAVYHYRDLPPSVEFQWTATGPTHRYRYTLAKDAAFKDVVVSQALDRPAYTHGNLKPGLYFWRVTAFTPWAESGASPVMSLRLVNDREPPPLDVTFPPAVNATARQVVSGTTEPGTRVSIAGLSVDVTADGHFSHELTLASGSNVIVVEAVDAAGNASFRSSLAQGRFP